MEPRDLTEAVAAVAEHALIFETAGLSDRLDAQWSGDVDGFVKLLAALRPPLLYRESLAIDEETIDELASETEDTDASNAVRRRLAELVADLQTRLGEVHTLTVGFARDGLMHGITVYAAWWQPFVEDLRLVADNLDAQLEAERLQRIEELAQAVIDHPDFRLSATARTIAFTLAPDMMTADEVIAASRRAKEVAEERLPDRIGALVAAGRTDAEIRAELGIGADRLRAAKAVLARWNSAN